MEYNSIYVEITKYVYSVMFPPGLLTQLLYSHVYWLDSLRSVPFSKAAVRKIFRNYTVVDEVRIAHRGTCLYELFHSGEIKLVKKGFLS